VIRAGQNRFAGLVDDDDAEDDFDEAAVAEGVLRAFCERAEVLPDWEPCCTGALLELLAVSQPHVVARGLRLLCLLAENGKIEPALAREALPHVVDVIRGIGGDLANCGLVFATLVRIRALLPDEFGTVFPEYHPEIVVAFLAEIARAKLVPKLQESDYWMAYRWRPPDADHLLLARAIAEMGSGDERADVSRLFPLYAKIAELEAIVADPEEEDAIPAWIDEFPEDVRAAPEFVAAALQIAVEAGDHIMAEIVPLFADRRELVLQWVDARAARMTLAEQERARLRKQVEQYWKPGRGPET
jgi:hypothetical protein